MTATGPVPGSPGFSTRATLSRDGVLVRAAAALALGAIVAVLPLVAGSVWDGRIAVMAIYGVIGLSIDALIAYTGEVSLGHQAFVGTGAFVSAYVATRWGGAGFLVALPVAALVSAAVATVVGLLALRVRGARLAVVTFVVGVAAEATVFQWRAFAGPARGAAAPRPSAFATPAAYAYLCLVVLAIVAYADWRLARSKAGRAMVAARDDPRAASSFGIDAEVGVLLAYGISGFFAGAAGSLYAHWSGAARAQDFTVVLAFTWVAMAVIGGLGSRAGVIVASAFFAVFPYLVGSAPVHVPGVGMRSLAPLTPLLAAVLLLLTLTLYPGGIGQQLLPIRRWLAGGPFLEPRRVARARGAIGSEPSEVEPVTVTPPGARARRSASALATRRDRAAARARDAARPDDEDTPYAWERDARDDAARDEG